MLIRASKLGEIEANLHLAQIYDRGMDESMFVVAIKSIDRYFSLIDFSENKIGIKP